MGCDILLSYHLKYLSNPIHEYKTIFRNVILIQVMEHLWKMGYSAEDIINNIFKVAKNLLIDETLKLDFVKVSLKIYINFVYNDVYIIINIHIQDGINLKFFSFQEIGITHLGIVDGVNSLLQMNSLLARLCKRALQ